MDTLNQHCKNAKQHIAKGDEYYTKALQEIKLAKLDGLSNEEISKQIGKSETWVADLLRADRKGITPSELWKDQRADLVADATIPDPEAVARAAVADPLYNAKVQNAIEVEREKEQPSTRSKTFDVNEGRQLERKAESAYFMLRDVVSRLQDTAPDDQEHLDKVFERIITVCEMGRTHSITEDDMEWLKNNAA